MSGDAMREKKKKHIARRKKRPLERTFCCAEKSVQIIWRWTGGRGEGRCRFWRFWLISSFFGGIAFNYRRQMYKNRRQNVHKMVPNVHKRVPILHTRRSLVYIRCTSMLCRKPLFCSFFPPKVSLICSKIQHVQKNGAKCL